MLELSFDNFFDKTLLIQESEGVIQHLDHLEELILLKKEEGVNTVIQFLQGLYESFQSSTESKVFATVKFDGAPAIIAGIHPQTNKFFVSTKSISNVVPKINYTDQDIQNNHGHAAELVEKLKLALKYLPAVIKEGVYQGDFMFSQKDLTTKNIKGEDLILFKPNTITYAIEQHSALGQRILNSKIGIIFHTKYIGEDVATAKPNPNVSVNEFNQTQDVFVDDAKFKDVSGTATLTAEESKKLESLIRSISSIGKRVEWEKIPDNVYSHLKAFVNTLVKRGEFVVKPEEAYNSFVENVTQKAQQSLETLKTEKGKQKRQQLFQDYLTGVQNNQMNLISLFNLTRKIDQAKKIFIGKYNSAIKTKQFLTQPNGTLKVTAPEGYVAVDHLGNMIKLVDRLEFSKANFALSKEQKFK